MLESASHEPVTVFCRFVGSLNQLSTDSKMCNKVLDPIKIMVKNEPIGKGKIYAGA